MAEEHDKENNLPDLTPKQMRFLEGILAGKTATQAYLEAYDVSGADRSKLWAEASKLRSHPKVATWLSACRQAGVARQAVTVESHLSELERLRELALERGQTAAAIQAEQARGKVAGLYVERTIDMSYDPKEALQAIAEIDPDLAKRLAERDGLQWDTETKTKH